MHTPLIHKKTNKNTTPFTGDYYKVEGQEGIFASAGKMQEVTTKVWQ